FAHRKRCQERVAMTECLAQREGRAIAVGPAAIVGVVNGGEEWVQAIRDSIGSKISGKPISVCRGIQMNRGRSNVIGLQHPILTQSVLNAQEPVHCVGIPEIGCNSPDAGSSSYRSAPL